ncbi:MAG: hypothetical protein U0103_21830 [Candidatus Obscuribacterales bacterium]
MASKGLKELPYTPDVVMFGSSLLTRIVNEGDATYLEKARLMPPSIIVLGSWKMACKRALACR